MSVLTAFPNRIETRISDSEFAQLDRVAISAGLKPSQVHRLLLSAALAMADEHGLIGALNYMARSTKPEH